MSQSIWTAAGGIIDLPPQPVSSRILDIRFPDILRARKVVTRSRARSTGKYPSWKMGRSMQWESTNELNAFRLLDCDPSVIRYSEQPCEITYTQQGTERRHFPDILVEYRNRKELWEVKSETEAVQSEFAERAAVLTNLNSYGYSYRVVLDRDLKAQPRLENAIRLVDFGYRPITVRERESMRLLLKRNGYLNWEQACAGVYGVKGRHILCRLLLEGMLSFDIGSPWLPETCFFPAEVL
jgi:hypothetical protein